MILHYIYDTHNGSKQLVGCVVRTDEGKLSYSAVHPKDRRKMSRKLARKIALGRAEKCIIAGAGMWWWKSRNSGESLPVPTTIVPYLTALAGISRRT